MHPMLVHRLIVVISSNRCARLPIISLCAVFALIANLFQSLYGAGWGNFANYETRSKKLLSDQLKDSPTGLCSKSFFSRAVCPNDS